VYRTLTPRVVFDNLVTRLAVYSKRVLLIIINYVVDRCQVDGGCWELNNELGRMLGFDADAVYRLLMNAGLKSLGE